MHRPGGPWGSVPVLYANGSGAPWASTNDTDFGFANQPGVVAIPGDYDGDGKLDLYVARYVLFDPLTSPRC